MLEVCKNQKQELIKPKTNDIIITKHEKKIEYNKDGDRTEKRVPKKVNVTKMVNERKKVIKQNKAQETLNEIEKIFTQKGV